MVIWVRNEQNNFQREIQDKSMRKKEELEDQHPKLRDITSAKLRVVINHMGNDKVKVDLKAP